MTSFDKMTRDEQVRHLTAFARAALVGWEGDSSDLELVLYANNAVFRAGDIGLRIYRPNKRPRSEIEAEWAWVKTLYDAGLHVPRALGPVYSGSIAGVAADVYAAGWGWLDGTVRELADYTPSHARAVGGFAAQMHLTAVGADTIGLDRPRLDYEGLFGERSPYNPKDGAQHISDEAAVTLDAVAGRVHEVMALMDNQPDTFGMIHGDFIYKNTLFDETGRVSALDFDDCGFGYYLYDLAVPLLFYKGLSNYVALKSALWDGYNTVRPLPLGYRAHLETLVAGRYVASCRWVAGNATHPSLRGRAREIIDGRAAELREFLKSGVL